MSAAINVENAVVVNGLGDKADATVLSEFFSFCGRIASVHFASADAEHVALVVFEAQAAAKTALLLSNAVVGDRAITVAAATAADVQRFDAAAASASAAAPTTADAARGDRYANAAANAARIAGRARCKRSPRGAGRRVRWRCGRADVTPPRAELPLALPPAATATNATGIAKTAAHRV